MEVVRCWLKDVENVLSELYKTEFIGKNVIFVDGGDGAVSYELMAIRIPIYGLFARLGTYSYWDDEEDSYMPDFSCTLLYDREDASPEEYAYMGTGGLDATLHDYIVAVGGGIMENCECLVVPEPVHEWKQILLSGSTILLPGTFSIGTM